jgi:hypothetical protein
LLSRLHRRAEALDAACLRALGHPNDYAIREELLSALEWEAALRPDHARPTIRDRFGEVINLSRDLANRLSSSGSGADDGRHPIRHGIERLRQSLAALTRVLAARQAAAPPPD